MVDLVQVVLGALVLWAPGLTWTWALAPGLGLPRFLAASVIVALSVQPLSMYLLSVFFGVRINTLNVVLLCLTLTALALVWAVRPLLERAWR